MNNPWEQLADVLQSRDARRVEQFLDALPWNERALAISRLSSENQELLLTTLAPAEAAELVDTLPDVQAADLIELLSPEEAADIVEELPSDTQADILGQIEDKSAEAILAEMDPVEAKDARTLRAYPEDVAGGIMVTEYLSYQRDTTAGQVIEDLRAKAAQYQDYEIQYLYVLDGRVPSGVIRIRDLLLASLQTPVGQIARGDLVIVHALDSLDVISSKFESCSFFGLPVVDDSGYVVGVVKRSAIEQARAAQSQSAYLASQGIVGEEFRSQPLIQRSRRRLSWLVLNIMLNMVSASVISFYQDTLSLVIALAVFLPIISDMSGASGSQAVAVSIRELSLGLVRVHELVRVLLKEIAVGLVNGAALGLLMAGVAWLWKGNVWLGVVAGGALAVDTVVAVLVGGSLPLLLKRMGFDPALASGVILTTITDTCGFFFALHFARVLMPLLHP